MATHSPGLVPTARTNSLGSAKFNCHTCSREGVYCDRQRPQCGPCLASNRRCGGFKTDIVWKNEAKNSALMPQARKDSSNRSFRFVDERIKAKRKPRNQTHPFDGYTSVMRLSAQECYSDPGVTPSSVESEHDRGIASTIGGSPWDAAYEVDVGLGDHAPQANMVFQQFGTSPAGFATQGEYDRSNGDGLQGTRDQTSGDYCPTLSGVLFRDATHKAGAILDMYDREFCVLPLTMDCRSNPFRVQKDSCEVSGFLLHAVLAISAQHLAKRENCALLAAESHNHEATAIRLFSEALSHTSAFKLLDTLLILVNFEATQTASSTWTVHLKGAKKILEGIGVARACDRSSKARAQVAMLVWWDITLALMSRKEMCLPLSYLHTLMKYDQSDGWTFFALSGCPIELVVVMARLTKLASIFETVMNLEYAIFDTQPVEAILAEVQQWQNPEDTTLDEMEQTDRDPHGSRNKYHCIEAWRHAILLYCYRVSYRNPDASRLRSIMYLARVVQDHVRCIPRKEIMQKQALLPMFLAAAEADDEVHKSFARRYCAHWSMTSGYDMFSTAMSLLERIWTNRDACAKGSYWWGVEVGNIHSPAGGEQDLTPELLLG